MTDITIFHYHLLPGGVTNVIELSVAALFQHYPETGSIRLVCGKFENTEKLLSRIHAECPDSAGRISIDIIPEIDYSEKPGPEAVRVIYEKLRQEYSGSLWIVHNYHLGKNPSFTEAVLQTALKNPGQKIVFYIHDFPECSRYSNLKKLSGVISSPAYPLSENVRYLLINNRDRKYLAESGVPDDYIFLVDNPVAENSSFSADSRMSEKLEKFNGMGFGRYIPGRPLMLYPVRSIRRKNVLEAVFLNKLCPAPLNLLVTLPGISKTEARYSRTVGKLFSEGIADGLFTVGSRLEKTGISFSELFASSDMIVSTSVQEGFGYLFIDSIKHRKPLFARYLEVISCYFELFPDNCTYFYTKAEVPLDKDLSAYLKKKYTEKITGLSEYFSKKDTEKLLESVYALCSADLIDFSYLPVQKQTEFIKSAHLSLVSKNEFQTINRNLVSKMNNLVSSVVPVIDTESRFGLKKYAERIKSITDSFSKIAGIPGSNGNDIQKNLLSRFASLEYLRLLYDWI